MRFVNLTHHPIRVVTKSGEMRELPPSGQIARCQYTPVETDVIDDIPIYRINYGEVIGLPEPDGESLFIVSAIVKNAVGDAREDVVSVYSVQRQENGSYCKGFRLNG